MKTGRRHELETNELADSLGHWVEAARPYTNAIVALVLLVVVAIAVFFIARSRSAAGTAQAWDEYFNALGRGQREPLEDLADAYAGTPVGTWSLCMAADLGLEQGSHELFRDKALGRDILRIAAEQYQKVLGGTSDDAALRQAWFGLARTQECLGELKQAQDAYERVVKIAPNTPWAAASQARIKDLERHETKEFYDWFAKQDIRRRVEPGPGTPGFRPRFDDLTLPESIDGTGGLPPGPSDDGQTPSSTPSDSSGTEAAPAETSSGETAPGGSAPDAGAGGSSAPADASGDKKETGGK